eukprot:scaffold88573_cov34-Phaeocystis_antarctica.AAC.1
MLAHAHAHGTCTCTPARAAWCSRPRSPRLTAPPAPPAARCAPQSRCGSARAAAPPARVRVAEHADLHRQLRCQHEQQLLPAQAVAALHVAGERDATLPLRVGSDVADLEA